MACIAFTIHHFFGSFNFSSVAEGCPFFCKNCVSSNPSGLSSWKGGESAITFRISATSVAEGVERVSFFASGSKEGTMLSFHFLEIAIFGS
jgi:pyruvate-formate lyase-activating enzyme